MSRGFDIRPYLSWFVLAVVVLALAAAWKWTNLSEWADPHRIAAWFRPWRDSWFALPLVVLVFVVAELVLFPVLVLVFVCGLAFGPLLGAVYALSGSVASAILPFLLGRKLGRERLERVGGDLVRRIERTLERRGVIAVFLVRKIPAPFTLSNLVCGASPVSLRDFVLGTILGMGTGIILITVLGGQLIDLVKNPDPGAIAGAVALLFVPLLLALVIQRALNRRERERMS